MTSQNPLLNWKRDSTAICGRIECAASRAKVILKTRNEDSILSEWISHHLKIFGSGGVVIFDHSSDNPETFNVYEDYRDDIQVFQFEGLHNLIHDTRVFSELYKAIQRSSDFFTFLDTDEFLYWNEDGTTLVSDTTIIDRVEKSGEMVVPGIWVENTPGDRSGFLYTFKQNRMISGAKGGKPFISTAAKVSGYINHNVQLDAELVRSSMTANLVVHHRKHLSAEQRMRANLNKLQSYNVATRELEVHGLIGRNFLFDDILAIDDVGMPPGNARTYVREIKELNRSGRPPLSATTGLARLVDGKLFFQDPKDESDIRRFIQNPAEVFTKAFA